MYKVPSDLLIFHATYAWQQKREVQNKVIKELQLFCSLQDQKFNLLFKDVGWFTAKLMFQSFAPDIYKYKVHPPYCLFAKIVHAYQNSVDVQNYLQCKNCCCTALFRNFNMHNFWKKRLSTIFRLCKIFRNKYIIFYSTLF
eukprot:TRINITY_DN12040_c0_g1_i2.p4 TRINITY_DN12040_c0_g1~~TRINITY_DN12040_c0_g1_i2.p4  ORF type:complete len:141 (+),score=1.90 TRINITY_DN12040_c0_g1_i2:715-1137(+)